LRAVLLWMTGSRWDGDCEVCAKGVTACGVGVVAGDGSETGVAAGVGGAGTAIGTSGFGVVETITGGGIVVLGAAIV